MSLNDFLAEYPSTNGRLLAGTLLAVLYVVVALGGMVLNRNVDINVLWAVGTFILLLSGIDATQFAIKRKTEIVTPPQTTAENAKNAAQETNDALKQ